MRRNSLTGLTHRAAAHSYYLNHPLVRWDEGMYGDARLSPCSHST